MVTTPRQQQPWPPGSDGRSAGPLFESAQSAGKQQLEQYAQAIDSGDAAAVGTANDILKQSEPALAFFKFFGPAYNAWTGAGVSYDALRHAYEAEYGLNFADYSSDSQLVADLARRLTSIEQNLTDGYNALVPTWQGDAASAFERELAVFFKATNTVTQDLAVVGTDIAALVHGLQQLVLAKAQTVSELYQSVLPNDIDGVMASTLVEVAKGEADKGTNLIAFYLLGGKIHHEGGFWHSLADIASLGTLDDIEQAASEDVAAQAAPGMAAQWCNSVLIPEFEAREQVLTSINAETQQRIQQGFAEFTGQVDRITDPYASMDKAGSRGGTGNAGPGGGGGVAPPSVGGGGLPGGADPKHDVHRNRDGSVSLGRARGLTISPEHGKNGVFTLTDTDPDGTIHTYQVHFDVHGKPVVSGAASTGGGSAPAAVSTVPSADLGSPAVGGGGGGAGLGAGGGIGGGIGADAGGATGAPATAHAGPQLQDGVHVGADNATSASSTEALAAPVAGSAAAGQTADGSSHSGGGFGGVPFAGGARGGGAGQEQESARRYPQRGEVVSERELEEWQRMGPVIGEQ